MRFTSKTHDLKMGPKLIRLEGEVDLIEGDPMSRYRAVWYITKALLDDSLAGYIGWKLAQGKITEVIEHAAQAVDSTVNPDAIEFTAHPCQEVLVVEV